MAWQQQEGSSCSADWLRQLWQRLATFPDLTPLQDWPLVPIQGQRLCQGSPVSQVQAVTHYLHIALRL